MDPAFPTPRRADFTAARSVASVIALSFCLMTTSANAAPSLAEQLAMQANAYAGSGYPEDEELLSEQSRDASGMPLPQGTHLPCAGCDWVLSAQAHPQRQVLQKFDYRQF